MGTPQLGLMADDDLYKVWYRHIIRRFITQSWPRNPTRFSPFMPHVHEIVDIIVSIVLDFFQVNFY